MTLLGLQAPGCDVLLGAVYADATLVNLGGAATMPVPIPNAATLAGTFLSAQSVALTLQNAAMLHTSNGVEGVLGL